MKTIGRSISPRKRSLRLNLKEKSIIQESIKKGKKYSVVKQ